VEDPISHRLAVGGAALSALEPQSVYPAGTGIAELHSIMVGRPRSHCSNGIAKAAIWTLVWIVLLRLSAPVLVPLAMALVFVLMLGGAVEWLQEKGVPPVLGAGGLVATTLAIFFGAAFLLRAGLDDWHTQALAQPITASRAASSGTYGNAAASWLQNEFASNTDVLTAQVGSTARMAGLYAASAAMLAFFALMSQRWLLAAFLDSAKSARARVRLVGGLREARRGIVAYLLTSSFMNLVLAVATTLALAAMGLSHCLLWATIIFGLLFIPYLGPLAITALLFVGADCSLGGEFRTVAPPLIFLALHAIEAVLISPWLVAKNVRISRFALVSAVLVGGATWGLAGGLLAVPLLIVARAALRRMNEGRRFSSLLQQERDVAPALQYWATDFGHSSQALAVSQRIDAGNVDCQIQRHANRLRHRDLSP
jgi:predicted PurR-regulated permease PerM